MRLKGKLLILIYKFWPPFLRFLESLKVHNSRQEYAVGFLREQYMIEDFRKYLISQGFEKAILAWKEKGEVLSMRKIDNVVFQYHIRVFNDGEIRAHYEYSSEGNPWKHIREEVFESRKDFFENLVFSFHKKI